MRSNRLTERDLTRIVKRILIEQEEEKRRIINMHNSRRVIIEQVAPFGDQQRAQLDTLKNPYGGIEKTSASANVKTGITEPENIMPNWVSKSTLKRYATNILDEWKHNDAYFVSILIADIFNPYGSFMKNFKPGSVADTPGDFNLGAKTASIGMNMTQTVKLAKEFSNHFKN